ncbi:MAG: hypothetical protein Q9187_002458 [Circinaria calcarea]
MSVANVNPSLCLPPGLNGLSLGPINDPELTQFISELKMRIDSRRDGYRGPVEYQAVSHSSGGFSSRAVFADRAQKYAVKSPEGKTYQRKKFADGAAAEVAVRLLEAGIKPPIYQEVTKESTTQVLSPFDHARLEKLEQITKHHFQDSTLALRALRHSSVGILNHDALAFLGDATIGSLIAHRLYLATPNVTSMDLSLSRGHLVENEEFEQLANRIGMTDLLEVGGGMSRSVVRGKMVADMFEAVIAVLKLEGGDEAVLKFWDGCHQAKPTKE